MTQKSISTGSLRAFFIFFTLFCTASPAFAQWGRYGDWHMGPGMMGSMGWFGIIFMLVFWILVIIGLILLIKWLLLQTRSESSSASKPASNALEILKERYARGEINKNEFEEKRKDLFS